MWQVELENPTRFEIWRKQWPQDGPSELSFSISYTDNAMNELCEYKVSPDGNRVLIVIKETITNYTRYFDFNYNTHILNIDDLIKADLCVHGVQSPLSDNLINYVWSENGEWIYAERHGEDNPGLVLFKEDSPREIQMVIPEFYSVSGITLVPK